LFELTVGKLPRLFKGLRNVKWVEDTDRPTVGLSYLVLVSLMLNQGLNCAEI